MLNPARKQGGFQRQDDRVQLRGDGAIVAAGAAAERGPECPIPRLPTSAGARRRSGECGRKDRRRGRASSLPRATHFQAWGVSLAHLDERACRLSFSARVAPNKTVA